MNSRNLLMPSPAPTLAVVIADARLKENVLEQLRSKGMAAWSVCEEPAFYRELAVRQSDIVLLDMGLPGKAGQAILEHLAPTGNYGLLAMVEEQDEGRARAAGAQCCVHKPVNYQHLLYSIAMLWECRSQLMEQAETWRFDPDGPRLIAPDQRSMRLTTNEARLLGGLMACYGQILTKDQLITMLWGRHSDRDYHGVEVLLSRLRRKAVKELGQTLPVQAVQAVGLIFIGKVTPNVP